MNATGCNGTIIMAVLAFVLLTTAMAIFFLGAPEPEVRRYKRRRTTGGGERGIGAGLDLPGFDDKSTIARRPEDDFAPVGSPRRSSPTNRHYTRETTKTAESETTTGPNTPTPTTTTTTTATTMTTTTATTTTTTTTTALPLRPVIQRAVLCTVGRYARADTRYPEDGLCDFLFCPVGLQANLQFTSFGDAFHGFREQAAVARKTKYGIDIRTSEMDTTLARLQTEQGVGAFRKLWDANIQQHGILYPVLYDGVNSSYVDMIIGLLNTLRRLQVKFRISEIYHQSHIFLGTAVVLHGNIESPNVKRVFTRIVRETRPDAILLRTHHVQKEDGDQHCRVTGPAIWQGNFSAQQPTFLDSLRFLHNVKIPENIAVLLSFTEASRWYRWDSANDSSFTLGEKCAIDFHTDLISRQTLCSDTSDNGLETATRHRTTQQMRLVHNRNSYGVVYDNKDTIRTKMCWIATTFGNAFGWAMFDLEFADTENTCKDQFFTKGFSLLRWMRHYIRTGFREPSECESS